jgi:PAS domain S-box-containing protein
MTLAEHVPDELRERYSLKLLAVSSLIILVIVAFSVVTALEVSERVKQEQLNSIEASAELEAKTVGQWIDGEREAVRLLSNRQGLDPANVTRSRETLERELAEMPAETAHLHLVERTPGAFSNGTNETIVASTIPTVEGEALSRTAIDWKPDVGYNFEDESDVRLSWVYLDGEEPFVAIASPIPGGEYALVAEYRTNVRAEQFTNVIEGADTLILGGFTAFVLFDDDASKVMTRYEGDRRNTTIGSTILDSDPRTELNGSVLTDTEVKGYHSVPGEAVDWVVVKEAPRSAALTVTDQVRTDLGFLIVMALFGFLLIGVVIRLGPISTVQRLTEQAETISRGDLSVDIRDEGRVDEIGQLRTAFRETKAYVETIAKQSAALSRQEFDAPVLEEDVPGRVGESMATMRTDLERFITELEEERNRYSTLVEQSSDGVVVVQGGRFVFANDRFLEITESDRETLLDTPVEEVLPAEVAAMDGEDGERRTSPEQYEIATTTRGEERRTLAITVSSIEHDGEPAVLANARDITDRERRERRLAVFNRVLRHNLRNQLDIIRSYAESIRGDEGDRHAARIIAATDTLAEIGDRARAVDQLMSRDRNESVVDLAEVLRATLASLDAGGADVSVTTAIPSTARLVTDREALELALAPPLENAFEYADSAVEVTLETDATHHTVVIADDGSGIPDQELASMYADAEPDLGHGRSLGLWELKCATDKLSGQLSFDTEQGTTVRITIPDWSDRAGAGTERSL